MLRVKWVPRELAIHFMFILYYQAIWSVEALAMSVARIVGVCCCDFQAVLWDFQAAHAVIYTQVSQASKMFHPTTTITHSSTISFPQHAVNCSLTFTFSRKLTLATQLQTEDAVQAASSNLQACIHRLPK